MPGLAGVTIDLTPLRSSRDFRLLFSSRTITLVGSQATAVALLLQLKDLTDSPVAVGLLGLAELAALVVFGLWGGSLGDRVDRRRLMVGTEVALIGVLLLLLFNGLLTRPWVWPLYGLAAVAMALGSLQRPSIDATVPRTVAPADLTAAAGVLGASSNSAMLAGAGLGGLLAAEVGPWCVYLLDAVSFAGSAACLVLLSTTATERGQTPGGPSVGSIPEGLRYVAGRPELIGSYLVDMAAMFFASVTALLPFVATALHARWALGILYAAPSAGAFIAATFGGWASRVRRLGRAIALCGGLWALSIVAFGLIRDLPLALFTLALAGGADMYSGMFRDTLWNRTIPDHLRGRVAGIELLSYGLGPSGGQLRAGAVASLTNVRAAIWSGGLLGVASILVIYRALPRFARFEVEVEDATAAEA